SYFLLNRKPSSISTVTSTLGVGSTIVSEKDGMTLIYVPAGEFVMGSNADGMDYSPEHKVNLKSFWIDETEVTNAQFVLFLNDNLDQISFDDTKTSVSLGESYLLRLSCVGCDAWESQIKWNGSKFEVLHNQEI